jgi:hypothetical protein
MYSQVLGQTIGGASLSVEVPASKKYNCHEKAQQQHPGKNQ